jgi:hypothetical protein
VPCQVERNEGSDAYYLDAVAPRGLKMQACVNWYSLGFKEDTTAHFWTYNLWQPRLDCFYQLWTATFRSYVATGLSVTIVERRPCIHSKRKLYVVVLLFVASASFCRK